MNLLHRWFCASSTWKGTVEEFIVPWVLDGIELGSDVLEVGPGYGATTDILYTRAPQLTCVEIDPKLAETLRRKMQYRNVRVICQDATRMAIADESFDGAVCFTMLHHVPSHSLQDRLLQEIARVLRPGGTFAGTDSLDRKSFRLLHWFDTCVPVPPDTFASRLEAAGFDVVTVDLNPYAFRFQARKRLSGKPRSTRESASGTSSPLVGTSSPL
jgi:SAM-dependent methyltransferase